MTRSRRPCAVEQAARVFILSKLLGGRDPHHRRLPGAAEVRTTRFFTRERGSRRSEAFDGIL